MWFYEEVQISDSLVGDVSHGHNSTNVQRVHKPDYPILQVYYQKKPPESMDDFFRQANKYAMLEDNIWAASPQILVTTQPVQDNKSRNSKTLGNTTRTNSQKPI